MAGLCYRSKRGQTPVKLLLSLSNLYHWERYGPFIPCRCPRGVMVKAMDCGIVVSEFELQPRYYVHFQANTLGKGMNPLTLPAMGQIVPLLFFLEKSFGIK